MIRITTPRMTKRFKPIHVESEFVTSVYVKASKGRPRIEDRANTIEAAKPWEALGISRRTFYVMKKDPERRLALDAMLKEQGK